LPRSGRDPSPLKEILALAPALPLFETGLVIDQDRSETDMLADLRTGLANIRRYERR